MASATENEVKTAIRTAEQGLQKIKFIKENRRRSYETATEFFDDIETKLTSVTVHHQRTGKLTDRQISAINNWYDAVSRWLRNDD